MARARGIKTIVDGAHAFAHFPFVGRRPRVRLLRLQPPQVALAPLGTGFLYVRRENIAGLWPLQPAAARQADNIRKFEEIGTHPAANHNAIAEALVFLRGIGIERKAARLRYLQEPLGAAPREDPRRPHPHAASTPRSPAASPTSASTRSTARSSATTSGRSSASSSCPSSTTITRASASRRTSTRRSMRSTPSRRSSRRWRGGDRCRGEGSRSQKPEGPTEKSEARPGSS